MTLRTEISGLLKTALAEAQSRSLLPAAETDDMSVERPQNPEHGDFSSSLPLKLARPMRKNPFAIAEALAPLVPAHDAVASVEVSKPGFVNFKLSGGWLAEQIDAIRQEGEEYGNSGLGGGRRVQVEFVSVNPTGPLHVGHARGAVFGSALAAVMEAAGYEVEKEYYLNDAGSQMDLFNRTLYARYRQHFGAEAEVPEDGYQGDYMIELAESVASDEGDVFISAPEVEAVKGLGEIGLTRMIDGIRADLERLSVTYDVWFSERSLYENGQYDSAMKLLGDAGLLSDHDGATWFTSTKLGDDDDKVMVRSTGAPTYFATDVAYHYNKLFERRFDRVIDVWGADHQGHRKFFRSLGEAMEVDPDRMDLLIYQLVTLKRGDEVVRASKRTGDFVTVRELVDEVGPDACRYFFLSRSPDSQMEFDLELAKSQSLDNPVYYVQYAHARISSILRLAGERGIDYSDGDLSLLTQEAELALVRKMIGLPELVEMMAQTLEPHHLPHYAMELATSFHTFYERCRVVSSAPEDEGITRARLKLVDAARTVLARCLSLMLMSAPQEM